MRPYHEEQNVMHYVVIIAYMLNMLLLFRLFVSQVDNALCHMR